jgi:hypothetical protein
MAFLSGDIVMFFPDFIPSGLLADLLALFVGRARFFARHDAFNVVLFGVQNSVHTLHG